MKITLLSTFDINGGAPLAAYRLLKGLRGVCPDTAMMVQVKSSRDPSVLQMSTNSTQTVLERKIFDQILKKEIMKNRTKLSETWFSIPYPGHDLSETDCIQQSDIINLHWIAGFQSVETISKLLKLDASVVWTLHDENPYTGGCHYSAGCEKYLENCKDCPQLLDNHYQLPFLNLNRKIQLWEKNLTIVTPSKWLAESAKKSRAFSKFRVEVIPNSLETDVFVPIPKDEAKKKINIEPQALTLLFGAHTKSEKRKGFNKMVNALEYCLTDDKFKKLAGDGGVKILTFGPTQENGKIRPEIEIKSMGYIDDQKMLSTIYSASDIFLLPSLEDNLPNTMLESMACGTPVIGFRVGGIPDMVVDGKTGFTAEQYNSDEMGRLILKVLFDSDLRKQMNQNCRGVITEKFKLKDQAEAYIDLFNDLRKNNSNKNNKKKSERPEHNLKEENDNKKENEKQETGSFQVEKLEDSIHNGYFELYRNVVLKMMIERDKPAFYPKDEFDENEEELNDVLTIVETLLQNADRQKVENNEQYQVEIKRLKDHVVLQNARNKEDKERRRQQIARLLENIEYQAARTKTMHKDFQQQIKRQKELLEMQTTQITGIQSILNKQINALKKQQNIQEEQNNRLRQQLNQHEQRVAAIRSSYSYRIGSALTFPARFVRKVVRRVRNKKRN